MVLLSIKLLFGIHCHQPVDNFHYVVEEAIEKSYKPFFKVANRFNFKFAVHYSGWLLEFIKNRDKELFKLMQEASEKGIVEFFSGGYYEPVLASIPSDDRKKQIQKLNDFIKQNFYQTPKGLWLTERVWDDSIIVDLVETGIEYVIVDDYHFISLGFKKEQLHGYYITEEEGYKLKIFPIDKTLRYITPFKPVPKVMEYLYSLPENKAGIIFDDGEKFGIWPKTYEWVYQEKWLENFLETVENDEKIESIHYKDFAQNEKPEGLVYLPTTSYYEMGEWSLFTDGYIEIEFLHQKLKEMGLEHLAEKYVKGSIWKNFLVKYPESNRIHKRTLELSKQKELKKDEQYYESVMKAECNDVLWHGVFGGLYLPNLRDNAYRFIIEAENRKDELTGEPNYLKIEDLNYDGYEEIKISNHNFIAVFETKNGGQLTELSLKKNLFNLQNTLTRRKEGYHEKILNPPKEHHHDEEGISTIHETDISVSQKILEKLKFDWYEKNSFIDHFTDDSISADLFDKCKFNEYGDFANNPFNIVSVDENQIVLKREGGIFEQNQRFDTSLTKRFVLQESGISFEIQIDSDFDREIIYLLEMNLHFANIENVLVNGKKIRTVKELEPQKQFKIYDDYLDKDIVLKFDKPAKLLTYTIETVSQSESGLDLTVQGQSFGFLFPFNKNLKIKGSLEIRGD